MYNFDDYLHENFSAEEIAEMRREVELEMAAIEATKVMQAKVAQTMQQYMSQEQINSTELSERIGFSPSKVNKILHGKINMNLSTKPCLARSVSKATS